MAVGKRRLGTQRRLLARTYAESGDVRAAEEAAGYSKNAGYNALRSPDVQAEVVRHQKHLLHVHGLPIAIGTLLEVATKADRDSSRVHASKIILEYTLGRPDSGVEKALDAMSDAELMEALQAVRAHRAELAKQVEATEIGASAEALEQPTDGGALD